MLIVIPHKISYFFLSNVIIHDLLNGKTEANCRSWGKIRDLITATFPFNVNFMKAMN